MKKILFKFFGLLFLTMVLPMFMKDAAAQPPPPPPQNIPVDGGLAFLVAAGTVYGVKKIRKQQKNDVK